MMYSAKDVLRKSILTNVNEPVSHGGNCAIPLVLHSILNIDSPFMNLISVWTRILQ